MTVEDLVSHASVVRRSAALAAACAEVRRTFEMGSTSGENRDTGPSWAAWHAAIVELRAAERITFRNPLWREVKAALATNDPVSREAALVYLEVDPWCFRSGYEKAELMTGLSRLALSHDERDRAQGIVIRVVQQPRRREFRQLVRLAASVHDADLDRRLDALMRSSPPAVGEHLTLLRTWIAARGRGPGLPARHPAW